VAVSLAVTGFSRYARQDSNLRPLAPEFYFIVFLYVVLFWLMALFSLIS